VSALLAKKSLTPRVHVRLDLEQAGRRDLNPAAGDWMSVLIGSVADSAAIHGPKRSPNDTALGPWLSRSRAGTLRARVSGNLAGIGHLPSMGAR
jgi:hypothetical protein